MYLGNLLNPDLNYSLCPTCKDNPVLRNNCLACFGTGKICRACLNNGTVLNTRQPCNCGINFQKSMFVEFNTMTKQHLVELPELTTGNSKYEVTSGLMDKLFENNYKIDFMDNIYARFAFVYNQPQRLMRMRVDAYNKLIKNGMPTDQTITVAHHHFLYIDAAELNSQEYLNYINQFLTLKKNPVLVFMGLSNLLPAYVYPFLPLISNNLVDSMIFFCDLGWLNQYGFLNINLVDGEPDDNDNIVPLSEDVFTLKEKKAKK